MLHIKIMLFFFIFIGKVYSSDEQINGAWEFYKVSSVDIFGESDPDTVRNLNFYMKRLG